MSSLVLRRAMRSERASQLAHELDILSLRILHRGSAQLFPGFVLGAADEIEKAGGQALPLVVVDYTYNIGGIGASYGDAYDRIADRSFEDHFFGFSAEIPIGNEAARSRVQRAVLTRLQRLATKEQRRLSIRQEVYDALDALDESWQRILAARLEARLNGRNYEGEQRQFDVGFRTSTDVLDAATRLANSQSREIRALADFQIARIDLKQAVFMTSLDYSTWFHRPIRADAWSLFDLRPGGNGGARGLALGLVHGVDGAQSASFTMELLMRPRA